MSGTTGTNPDQTGTSGAAVGGGGSGGTSVGGSTTGVTGTSLLPPQYATGDLGFFTRQTEPVPTAVTVGPDGAIYVSGLSGIPYPEGYANIYRIDGSNTTTGYNGTVASGVPQVYASGFSEINGLAFNNTTGDMFVLEYNNSNAIYDPTQSPASLPPSTLIDVKPDGTRTTISGPELHLGNYVLVNQNTGDVYVAIDNQGPATATSPGTGEVLDYKQDPTTGAWSHSVIASGLNSPRGMAIGPDGNLYVLEQGTGTPSGAPGADSAPVIPFIPGIASERGGNTGSITRVDITNPAGGQQTVLTGLASFREFNPTTNQDRVISIGMNGLTITPDGTVYIAAGGGLAPETAAAVGPLADQLQGVLKVDGLFGPNPSQASVTPEFNSLQYAQQNGPDGATTQFNTESNLNDIVYNPGDKQLYAVDAARNVLYGLTNDGSTVADVTVMQKQPPVLTPPQYAAEVAAGGDPTEQYQAEISSNTYKNADSLPDVPGNVPPATLSTTAGAAAGGIATGTGADTTTGSATTPAAASTSALLPPHGEDGTGSDVTAALAAANAGSGSASTTAGSATGGATGADTTASAAGASAAGAGATTAPAATDADSTIAGSLVLQVSEDAYQGDAQFTVSLDGTQLGGVQTATAQHSSGDSQAITFTGTVSAGTHTVSVDFLNDAWGGPSDPTDDRNLYVQGATIYQDGASPSGVAVPGGALTEDTNGSQSFTFTVEPTTSSTATTGAGATTGGAATSTTTAPGSAATGAAATGTTPDTGAAASGAAPTGTASTGSTTDAGAGAAGAGGAPTGSGGLPSLPTVPVGGDSSLPGPTDPTAPPVLPNNTYANSFAPFFGGNAPAPSDPLVLKGQSGSSYTVSKLIVFGDRLADNGNTAALEKSLGQVPGTSAAPYSTTGNFSDGQQWTTDLAQILGATAPSQQENYAYESATARPLGVANPFDPDASQTPLSTFAGQIEQFQKQDGYVSPNAEISITFGGNDISLPSSESPTQGVTDSVNAILSGMQTLVGDGAEHFLVSNLPDITLAPLFSSPAFLAATGATTAGFQGLVNSFNTQLAAGLTQFEATNPGVDVKELDLNTLFNGIAATPSDYGFTNTTQPVLSSMPTVGTAPTYNPSIVGQDPQVQHGSLFLDPYFDPTELGQTLIAQTARSTLTA